MCNLIPSIPFKQLALSSVGRWRAFRCVKQPRRHVEGGARCTFGGFRFSIISGKTILLVVVSNLLVLSLQMGSLTC